MFAVSFAIIVVLRPPLFAENVVSKSPCLRFKAFMFAVRYNYKAVRLGGIYYGAFFGDHQSIRFS